MKKQNKKYLIYGSLILLGIIFIAYYSMNLSVVEFRPWQVSGQLLSESSDSYIFQLNANTDSDTAGRNCQEQTDWDINLQLPTSVSSDQKSNYFEEFICNAGNHYCNNGQDIIFPNIIDVSAPDYMGETNGYTAQDVQVNNLIGIAYPCSDSSLNLPVKIELTQKPTCKIIVYDTRNSVQPGATYYKAQGGLRIECSPIIAKAYLLNETSGEKIPSNIFGSGTNVKITVEIPKKGMESEFLSRQVPVQSTQESEKELPIIQTENLSTNEIAQAEDLVLKIETINQDTTLSTEEKTSQIANVVASSGASSQAVSSALESSNIEPSTIETVKTEAKSLKRNYYVELSIGIILVIGLIGGGIYYFRRRR